MRRPLVFDIQRFCIHDGPGIRTVVFLKGCPIRCEWCSNPESQSIMEEILFDAKRCIGCGACLAPECGGVMKEVDGKPFPDRGITVPPGIEAVCPSLAIRVAGQELSPDDIVTEVMKDESFYRKSGGGVTFSGGEPLLYARFLLQCIEKLHGKDVSVAIESCLVVKDPPLGDFFAYPIHWLLDLKHVSPGIFKARTGGDLATVLSNVKMIAEKAPKVTYRIPLIPDFNDQDEDRERLLDFIAGLERAADAPAQLHILPYHDLAAGKYSRLGRKYLYAGKAKIDQQALEAWRDAAARRGFDLSIGG